PARRHRAILHQPQPPARRRDRRSPLIGPQTETATGRRYMNFGGTTFVLAIIALSIGGWMFTTWIRAKHGYPVENEWGGTVHRTDPDADRKIALLIDDNAKLAGQVSRLEERIAVLERIATEEGGKAAQLADQIDRLR